MVAIGLAKINKEPQLHVETCKHHDDHAMLHDLEINTIYPSNCSCNCNRLINNQTINYIATLVGYCVVLPWYQWWQLAISVLRTYHVFSYLLLCVRIGY